MTRAQIADPDLVAKLRAGAARADPPVHPLQPDVPGARRPQPDRHVHRRADLGTGDGGSRLVRAGARRRGTSPSSAADRPGWRRPVSPPRAAIASCSSSGRPSSAGWRRSPARTGRSSTGWRREVDRLGVDVRTGTDGRAGGRRRRRAVHRFGRRGPRVRGRRRCGGASTSPTCAAARRRCPTRGDVVVFDPIGGPIGVALAEELGGRAVLVTQDNIAGNELARTRRPRPGQRPPRPGRRAHRAARPAAARRRRRASTVARPLHGRRPHACRAPRSSTAASACPTRRARRRRRPGRRLRRAAHRPRGDPRGPARRRRAVTGPRTTVVRPGLARPAGARSVRSGRGGRGGRRAGRTCRGRRRRAGSRPSRGRRRRPACATGAGTAPGGRRTGASR